MLALAILSIHGGAVLAHKQSTVVLEVDCDSGDDLETIVGLAFSGVTEVNAQGTQQLRHTQGHPGMTAMRSRSLASEVQVNLRGTCTANLVVPASMRLVILGQDPESSVIQGALNEHGEAVDGVFRVDRSAELMLQDLTVSRGSAGIYGDRATINVYNTHFRDNLVALSAGFSDATVLGCRIEVDQDHAAIVMVKGILTVLNTDILNTGSVVGLGILADLGATAIVEYCQIDNLEVALSARRGSFMQARNLTTSSSQYEIQSLGGSFVSVHSSVLEGSVNASTSSTV
jgi:hypothetical protein